MKLVTFGIDRYKSNNAISSIHTGIHTTTTNIVSN